MSAGAGAGATAEEGETTGAPRDGRGPGPGRRLVERIPAALLPLTLLAAAVGLLLPSPWVADHSSWLLALLVLCTALAISPSDLLALRRRRGAVLALSTVPIAVLAPLAWLLSRLFAPPVRDGVFALGLAPTEVAAAGLVALAAGDAALAVAAVTGSLLVSALVGPLAATVGGGAGGGGLGMLGDFALAVLLPLAAGIALRANAPGLARAAPELGAGATLAVAALVYAALSGTGGSELSSTVVGALAFLGLTFAVALAGRQALPVDDRVTVPLVVALRDFAVAAALATPTLSSASSRAGSLRPTSRASCRYGATRRRHGSSTSASPATVRRPSAGPGSRWGAGARRELTLASDQDNALAYDDAEPGREAEVDRWFARFGAEIDAGLARCGFGPDAAEVLASNRAWRKSRSEWAAVLGECLEYPDRSHLVRAAVTFDFRHVAGGLDVVAPFTAAIRKAPAHPDFIARLARTATDARPPLGFRGSLRASGRRTIDIKRGGVVPVTNLARFHAVAGGITISATLDRIAAVEATGVLDTASAQSLREAYGFIARLRLEHHAAQVESGAPLDDLIEPGALPPLVRAELRKTFRAVADAQKRLGVYAPTVGR